MRDSDPIVLHRGIERSSSVGRQATANHSTDTSSVPANTLAYVAFNRKELNQMLGLYGRKVAAGEWRDYAIDMLKDRAVFSIFRRSSEFPIYRIEKDPRLSRRQGAYRVVTASGQILKRGNDLARVIAVIDRRLKLVEA